MEDAHFCFDNVFNDGSSGLFSVLDGHGGSDVVEYCTSNLPSVWGSGVGLKDDRYLRIISRDGVMGMLWSTFMMCSRRRMINCGWWAQWRLGAHVA